MHVLAEGSIRGVVYVPPAVRLPRVSIVEARTEPPGGFRKFWDVVIGGYGQIIPTVVKCNPFYGLECLPVSTQCSVPKFFHATVPSGAI